MRRFVRVRTGLPCALAVVLSLLVLAGCGKDNATTNAANARTDATLQTLATTAWGDAGYTGQTATSTDPSNSSGMSTGTSTALGSAVTQAEASNGISSVSSAGTLQQTIQAIQTQGTALALALSQPGASPLATTTVTLNNIVSCSGGGQATVTGTVSATSTSSGGTVSANDVQVTLSGCDDGTYVVTGSVLFNADDTVSITQTGSNSFNAGIHLDQYADGGLAIYDQINTLYYNPIFRYTVLGDVTLSIVNSALTGVSGSVTVTSQVNNVTCTGTATFASDLSESTSTWSCTVG